MKLNKIEQIELTTEEVRALDLVRRLGEQIAGCSEEEENIARGDDLARACDALSFVHRVQTEDPDDIILRRKDLWHANEGDWNIEDLKKRLPKECVLLIEREIENARDEGYDNGEMDGYDNGHQDGYDEGYKDRMDEEEDE